jgi:selenocysteine lyase/cysteine desulfurase
VEEERRLFVNVKVKDNRRLEAELFNRKIAVSARVGGLRISPHFYNSEEDIEALLRELRALKGATM